MSEPLTLEQLAALREFSTPTICNAIETFNLRARNAGFMDHTIACRFPELGPMVGYAVTARIRAKDPPQKGEEMSHSTVWAEFEKIPKPWVVVIEDLDAPNLVGSYWGEVNGATYAALGAVGVVTNGGVRDLPEVRPTGFQFFSAAVLVSHAYVHVVEAGRPVTVGGLTVTPGDLMHGDEHGLTSVPLEIAIQVPDACRAIETVERRLIDYARSGKATVETLAKIYREVD